MTKQWAIKKVCFLLYLYFPGIHSLSDILSRNAVCGSYVLHIILFSLLNLLKEVEIVILGDKSINKDSKDHWKKYRKNHWKKYRIEKK